MENRVGAITRDTNRSKNMFPMTMCILFLFLSGPFFGGIYRESLSFALPECLNTICIVQCTLTHTWRSIIDIVMPTPLGTGGIMFSGCPSVRPSEA